MQYAISIALMICTGVMIQQQAYARNKNLGYDQERVVVVSGYNTRLGKRYKQELLKDPYNVPA